MKHAVDLLFGLRLKMPVRARCGYQHRDPSLQAVHVNKSSCAADVISSSGG
jgi:hypothetical protein